MSVNKSRGFLYKLAKWLGDSQAVKSGDPNKIVKRAGRRVAGKATGRTMRKLFK